MQHVIASTPKTPFLALLLLVSGCNASVDLASERDRSSVADGAAGAPADNETGGAGTVAAETGGSTSGTGGGPGTSPGCDSLSFRARTDAYGTPISVVPGTESNECFGYHVNPPGSVHITAFTPVIDNEVILHHFQLFQVSTPQVNGSDFICEAEPTGELVYSWEPGTGDVTLPPGDEIALGTGDFVLRVHYANPTDQIQRDTSGAGARVCGN